MSKQPSEDGCKVCKHTTFHHQEQEDIKNRLELMKHKFCKEA